MMINKYGLALLLGMLSSIIYAAPATTVTVQVPGKSEGPVIVHSPTKSEGPVIVSAPSKSVGPVIVQSTNNPNGSVAVKAPTTSGAAPASAPQAQVQTTLQQPTQQSLQQVTPVMPTQRVLAIDMEGNGSVDDLSLQQGKAALLVLRLNPTQPSHGLGIFEDQAGNHYRVIKDIKDLASLMEKDTNDINEGDDLYERLRLGYILLNGRIQTVSLASVRIIVIHIGNTSDENSNGLVDAYAIGRDNISRMMQEVMWNGYLE